RAEAKQVVLRQELNGAGMTIAGDPARLQQIVGNLLWNAIKFTPAGGVITVRLRDADAGAEIIVTDTGSGIRPEILPHIFDRFTQASLLNNVGGGLGLGLSIAKHLVELHGGTISAESPGEGKGATFTVVLPSGSLPKERDDAAGMPMAADPSGLQDLRILV